MMKAQGLLQASLYVLAVVSGSAINAAENFIAQRPCYRRPGVAALSGPATGMDRRYCGGTQRLGKEGVVGHGALLGREHRDLANRLQHGTAAMVEPHDPAARAAWQEILEILFSPEDAALAARLPVLPTPLETLAARTGLDQESLRRRLDALADRGLVLDLVDAAGTTTYMLAPPMVGFFEFSMMRLADGLPKERLATAYHAYVEDDLSFLDELSGTDTLMSRTLVHETALYDNLLSEVLDWERATACVAEARRVSVTNCYCRHKAKHLDAGCDYPMESCVSLGVAADYLIRHGFGREISQQEGLELLTAAREAGLVHIADNVQQDIAYICSCCSCCCVELQSVRAGKAIVLPSGFRPAHDAMKCTGCGRCVHACPVQALSLVSRGEESRRLLSRIDYERCLGCGVCASVCRHDALKMERRPQPAHVPLNVVEFATRRMIERGRLADFLVDGTAGRGPAFAHAVLGALLSLPPAERLLASEQVRSRFVRFALARH
jgi:Pyruvate/2-oxoacid:ferredoxin oxidoreductase delta subunit